MRYFTKNTCIRIVDGVITMRWWRSDFKRSKEDYGMCIEMMVVVIQCIMYIDSPCRLSIALTGMEYVIYNNSYFVDRLKVCDAGDGDDI